MPPKKTGQSRVNQRQQNKPKPNAISEFSDLMLYEHLSKEDAQIEELLDQIKDVSDNDARENILQNFVTLIFKLVGLNSFVIKLEGKSFSSIDEAFMKAEIEQNLKKVRDFNWVFTAKKDGYKLLKDNLYVFFDSIIQQSQYYSNEDNDEQSESFLEQLSTFFILLSRSNIQNVRQNVIRLVRIFVEQGLLKLEKLSAAEKRKLDGEEQLIQKRLGSILQKIIQNIFNARVIDKNEGIQQDCLDSFDIFFSLSSSIALTSQNLIQLSTLFDGNIDLVNHLLKVLINIKWNESDKSKAALTALIQNDKFRKRLVYFSNFTSFTTSYRSIQFINIVEDVLPSIFKDKDLKKALATIFHPHEEVRGEGLKILYGFLSMKESESKISRIVLDGDENNGVNDIFWFKLKKYMINNEQQVAAQSSMTLIKRFYTLLDEVDPKIYEKEDLIQNLVNSLGFEFGVLYDFQSIFKLLNQLPSSNLKDKIFDLFKLIIVILKKTMKLLQLIQQGEKVLPNISQQQREKLLLIKSEFFQALTNNFDQLYINMNSHIIFKEYAYHLFLCIPTIDLQQNLKESQFKSFSKTIAQDIFQTITNQDEFITHKSHSMGLIFSCFNSLQYFLANTARAYIDPFKICKEKVIKSGIVDATENMHQIIVQGQDSSLDLSDLQEEYTFLFIKLFGCTNLLTQLDNIYSQEFIQKCLEITDAATSSTSSDNTCIYTFTSLGLQLDFYLNVLKLGFIESCTKAPKLEEYLKYRVKVIKQLWIFLKEEKKKAIQFNLETNEYKKILFKSYYSIIQGLNFFQDQKLRHLPITIKLSSDDPIFYALIDYVSYYNPSEYNSNIKADDKSSKASKKMIAEGEGEEEEGEKKKKEEEIQPINEKVLMSLQSISGKQITDLQLIIFHFCTFTLFNPRYLISNFGIYVFKNFFNSESKDVVEMLRKNMAASRLIGDRSSGFPPFWKCFDEVINQLLDEKKDSAQVKKFVIFAHKAYFNEVITDPTGANNKPKDHLRELCERQIYYLTAKTGSLLDTPNKLSTLETLGTLLSIKVNLPKAMEASDLQALQSLQKKYHTFFLKKVQDYVNEFKEKNTHLQSLDGTILSEHSKQIVYRYVKHLEIWSTVKFNVDPYGQGEEVLNEQREAAERSIKKQEKETEDEDDEQEEEDNEQSDKHEGNNESENESNKEEEEEIPEVKQIKNKRGSSKTNKSNRGRSTSSKEGSNKKKPNMQMEAEEEKNSKTTATRKTKKEKNSSASTKINDTKNESKPVEVSKKNYRRQPNKK